jgi:hypothetical protein
MVIADPTPLAAFEATSDPHGGEVQLNWTLPTVLPTLWQVYIFKKQGTVTSDTEISQYFSGHLSDAQLADLGIYVFRDLDNAHTWLVDFSVENGKQYFYRALIRDKSPHLDMSSTTVDLNITPEAQIKIYAVDGKSMVVRAVEKAIDAIKSIQGQKPELPKNLRVVKNYSSIKEEDFFVVVSRLPGQLAERYFSSLIAEYGNNVVKGESDIDAFQVEWVCVGNPARRDKFTDIMRVMRPIMRHYIMRAGNGMVWDVKFLMSGDSEGEYAGAAAVRGLMNVALVIEQQLQVGGQGKHEWLYVDNTYSVGSLT